MARRQCLIVVAPVIAAMIPSYASCGAVNDPLRRPCLRTSIRSATALTSVIGTPRRYSTEAMSVKDPCGALGPLADTFKVTPMGFHLFAVANLDEDPELDVWSIDQGSKLEHLTKD